MNNKLTLTTLAIAALGIGIATSAPARAASGLLDKCHFNNNRQVVEKCCDTWISQRGKPMWFTSESSCSSVVTCRANRNAIGIVAVAYVPKCRIEMPSSIGGGGSKSSIPRLIQR